MILIYEVMLWRAGNTIKGTAEKNHENSSTKHGDYIGKNRTRSQVEGNIEKRYFGADLVCLHFVDQGIRRESTTIFELTYHKDTITMSGIFYATAGSSSGEAHIRKK